MPDAGCRMMEMEMAMAEEEEAAVRTFLALVNRSQTRELVQWNAESLRRALRWAAIVEAAAVRGEEQQQSESESDTAFRSRFPLTTLPTLEPGALLRQSDLKQATQHLLGAILMSPFLASSPIRSELLALVLAEARAQRQAYPDAELVSTATISRFLAKAAVEAQRARASSSIALAVSKCFKPITVAVLNGPVTVPPVESYQMLPRTIKLHQIASTLQRNAINARSAADQEQYTAFLSNVRSQLRHDSSRDVAEVLALLVTRCKWPPPMLDAPLHIDNPAIDIAQILVDWAADKASRCMALPPWPAALLSAKSGAFAAVYVAYLLCSGFLEPDNAFAIRVATLVTQSERLAAIVNTGLAQIDPLVLSKLLPGDT